VPTATLNVPAATAKLFDVVNAGQLSCNVPEPAVPFARYTVPCTVVVLIVCAAALQTNTTAATQRPIHLPALQRFVPLSFILDPSSHPRSARISSAPSYKNRRALRASSEIAQKSHGFPSAQTNLAAAEKSHGYS
jgi:hypothetical protein